MQSIIILKVFASSLNMLDAAMQHGLTTPLNVWCDAQPCVIVLMNA